MAKKKNQFQTYEEALEYIKNRCGDDVHEYMAPNGFYSSLGHTNKFYDAVDKLEELVKKAGK